LTIIINILLFIVILGFIVFVHEFGHFTWAKICGVYVYEFAIGMGPKIWSHKGKETEYSLRAIPIGGFCALAGEDVEDDEKKKIPKNRRLQDKNPFQRFLIMFFGAGNNFLSAFLILFFIALIFGGNTMNPVITEVVEDSAAEKVGLKENDKIVEINGTKVVYSDDVSLFLAVSDPAKKTTIVVDRKGKEETFKVKPNKVKVDGQESYVYGIALEQKETHGFVASLSYMVHKGASLFRQMWYTVKFLFTGVVGINDLSGPVGIYSIVGQQREAGLKSILFLVAYLSINVGFINLLPLPAFDGGHIIFILIEILRFGKPVNPKVENYIHTIGMILLMILMLYVTIHDIIRLF